jgi:hypothetical protein
LLRPYLGNCQKSLSCLLAETERAMVAPYAFRASNQLVQVYSVCYDKRSCKPAMRCDSVTNTKLRGCLENSALSACTVQYVSCVSLCGEAPAICNELLQREQAVEAPSIRCTCITNHASFAQSFQPLCRLFVHRRHSRSQQQPSCPSIIDFWKAFAA